MQIIGVVLILIIIGLYVRWIFYIKNQKAVSPQNLGSGTQVFDVTVKGVYSPSVLKASLGKPVRINFTRQESVECSRFVNFSDFKIRKELPEGKTVSVEFMPNKKGIFLFNCDMSMYQGKLIVE